MSKKSKSLHRVYQVFALIFAIILPMVILHKFFHVDIGPYALPVLGVLWMFTAYHSHEHMFFEKKENIDERKD
ncbi:hypothetical protein ACO0LF_01315 [Undibacterium sp. Di27W]|uniref:hypothetical protein n=1 Tax=Undibacterium sp. Di27W TaxID=3413036 RepID=UPI003BEFCD8F